MKVILFDIQEDTTSQSFLQKDYRERINILKQRLEALSKIVNKRRYEPVQAILTAPENYFARSNQLGQDRQYKESIKNEILLQVSQLSKRYPTILIIPGTISWKKPAVPQGMTLGEGYGNYAPVLHDGNLTPQMMLQNAEQKRLRGEPNDFRYSIQSDVTRANDNIRQYGQYMGDSRRTGIPPNSRIVKLRAVTPGYQKILASKIPDELINKEFGYNSAYIYLGGQQLACYDKSSDFEESLSSPDIIHVTGGFPSIVPITSNGRFLFDLGIEICLDHACGILSKYNANLPAPPFLPADDTHLPDIHLVLSASVNNEEKNICVKEGGYFIHSSSSGGSRKYQQRAANRFVDLPFYTDGVELCLPVVSKSLLKQFEFNQILAPWQPRNPYLSTNSSSSLSSYNAPFYTLPTSQQSLTHNQDGFLQQLPRSYSSNPFVRIHSPIILSNPAHCVPWFNPSSSVVAHWQPRNPYLSTNSSSSLSSYNAPSYTLPTSQQSLTHNQDGFLQQLPRSHSSNPSRGSYQGL